MVRQLTVDFNRVVDGALIRGNARRAVPGTDLEIGSVVVVGDDDRGVASAEVVEHDRVSGALVLRLLGELTDERASELSRPA
jgi:ribosomal protein L21